MRSGRFDVLRMLLAGVVSAGLSLAVCASALAQAAPPLAAPPPAAPAGIRVYNSDLHDPGDGDLGGPPAISLAAPRNGAATGKVVVGGGQVVQGLKAALGDLRQGETVLPASAASVRYGLAWDLSIGSFYRPKGEDILLEAPLAEFRADRTGRANAPIFVTVMVPKDAKPGAYAGQLTIEAKGLDAVKVPVKLQVEDWTLPDTQQWRTWIELVQSPDNLAVEYGLPLWSDKHWEMIGKSLRLIGQTGSRVLYLPLIARTNQGNEQSMVRWVRKGENQYDYDFSVMEKYLDVAEKQMGKPKLVILYAWEVYLNPPKDEFMAKVKERGSSELEQMQARVDLRGKGPPVTVLEAATRKAETFYLPRYDDPAAQSLWRPVWEGVRQRLQKRGLEKAAVLGMVSDWWPTKEDTAALNELSGGLAWANCSHHTNWLPNQTATGKGALYGIGTIGYVAAALEFEVTINPAKERSYGWKNPVLFVQFWRGQYYNYHTHSTIRHEPECNITGSQRGIAHLGADFWYSVKDSRGRRASSVAVRYPESYWHSLNIHGWLLGPGPDGPVGTVRLEVFREGVQECEARIFIESALTDDSLKVKLGPLLAAQAQQFLDDKQRDLWRAKGATEEYFEKYGHVPSYKTYDYELLPKWKEADGNAWFIKSGWQAQTARLYALAGEVAGKLAAQ